MNLPVGKSVEYFMRAMGQHIPETPTMPDDATWKLRRALINEEHRELREAYEAGDFPAYLDAVVDFAYVVIGAALDAGLTQFDEAFAAVHRANMAKMSPCETCQGTGKIQYIPMGAGSGPVTTCGECAGRGQKVRRRVDGKVMKPVGWVAPDTASIIWKEKDASPTTVTPAE